MCDTIIATPSVTKHNVMLFGKNSDREPDEAQNIVIVPHQTHKPGSLLKCTYIEIPQVEETNRILLSQPFWMWGAEMGANEHGVVIGNEALLTKVKPAKSGLTGMDLLRLGLERGN
ncbi:MAG: peptidase U34, partial [Promethearchaeota archaeon]